LNNLHRQESTQIIAYTLIFLGMTIAMFALYQFLTGSNRVWHVFKPYPNRASGTYISPNHLGGFLEMVAPLGLAYTVLGRSKPLMKVFLGYASLVMLAGIGVTISRGSWISTGLVLLLFLLVLMFRQGSAYLSRFYWLILEAGAVFTSRLLSSIAVQTIGVTGQVDDDMRFALWEPAVRVWRTMSGGGGPPISTPRFNAYRPLMCRPGLTGFTTIT
jgi:hypothetical protein